MYITDLLQREEQRHRAAERAVADAKDAVRRLVAQDEAAGTDLSPAAAAARAALNARGDELARNLRAAKDELEQAKGALKTVREAAAEEAEWARQANETYPTPAAALLHGRGGEESVHDLARGRFSAPLSAGPQWIRKADGRPGAVARGQRFADHEVVAETIARSAERDRHLIGMHGGLGSLVRSMSTTSGSAVVPQVWAADVIDRARNLAAVIQAGAQLIPMDAKIVQIGRLTADPAAGFRAEGSAITATDPTFDNVTLTATTLSALVIGSLEWFQDVTPGGGADQLVGEALAKVIALQIDLAALMGGVTTGGEGINLPNPPNPRGILATLLAVASSSVLGAGANGTAQTAATPYNEVLDTIYTPRDNNEAPTAMIWPSRLARKYAEFYDTTNQPMRQPPDVEQITKYVSNQVPSGFNQGTGTTMADLFVGDFRQLLIGQRLDLQIQTLTERYAELGQVGIVATWRGDIQLARPRAFSVFRYLKGV